MLSEEGSGHEGKMLLGDLLVIAGQFANAVQFIVEEVCSLTSHYTFEHL